MGCDLTQMAKVEPVGFTVFNPTSLGTITTCRHKLREVSISFTLNSFALSAHITQNTFAEVMPARPGQAFRRVEWRHERDVTRTKDRLYVSRKFSQTQNRPAGVIGVLFFSGLNNVISLHRKNLPPASRVDDYLSTIYIIDKDHSQYGAQIFYGIANCTGAGIWTALTDMLKHYASLIFWLQCIFCCKDCFSHTFSAFFPFFLLQVHQGGEEKPFCTSIFAHCTAPHKALHHLSPWSM